MQLTVFGATGQAGSEFVAQALAQGYHVVAFARNPAKLTTKHPNLMMVQGELADTQQIERAISGADAVISFLGPPALGKFRDKPLTRGTENIIAAMKKQGVRRLIVTGTATDSDPNDLIDFKFKALVLLIQLTMRGSYQEMIGIANVVRASGLDWTIIRLPSLVNRAKSGKVRVGYVGRGEVGSTLSYADLANFILKHVQDRNYLRQAPAISN